MRASTKFALWLALLTGVVIAVVAAVGVALWLDLSAPQRDALRSMLQERPALFVVIAFFVPFALGALLQWWFAAYPKAATRMAEEVRLIHTVNPEHRVTLAGASELRQLGGEINHFAAAHQALRQQVEARIGEANAHLEQEKNRLAALMSELAQSVLVCNSEGRILLYNARASALLEGDAANGAPVGLGRSIFGILDKSPIVHALDKIARRLEQHSPQPVAHFVTTRAGQLLRGQMAPVLDAAGAIGGFVLMLEDITRSVEINSRRDFLLQQLSEGLRASLANIRAAAETMAQHPEMDAARRERFTEVIRVEAEKLSQRLHDTLDQTTDSLRAPWLLEEMLASDLVFALQRSFEAGLGVTARHEGADAPFWLSVDSYAMVQALTQVMGRVASTFGTRAVVLQLGGDGRFVRLTLCWQGPPLEPGLLHDWESQPFTVGAAGHAATLKEVLDQHGGEMWCQADRGALVNRLHLQLPMARPERPPPAPTARSRPVYYDFDLFSQPGQTPELDQRALSELSYTVFDSETTGLSPSEGDEIVSIGAVRIVNGRLLEQECFDRLVQPRRAVRKEAQEVHGISMQMLAGQPTIEEVLPLFHRFAEDTVLIAHNASFDMRFLQIAQARSGVAFDQPVLDTLLLSALVHPGHTDAEHRLEQIAARLGVNVIGRHTALGDAIVTGEVFLKLVPLLAERGIHTLKQAREASRTTLYAKLEY